MVQGLTRPSPAPQPQAEVPPEPARDTRVVSVVNQKGGVGKSTTAVNLGAAVAETGRKVLVVDLDPQGNASTGLGIEPARRQVGTYQVMSQGIPAEEAILETVVAGVWAIPSTIDLAGAEIELVGQISRETKLARAIEPVLPRFDFVFLDCPPSLGLLTVNALAASDELMVPIQSEYYALEGLGQLLRNVRLVQQSLNPRLRLTGIVITMYDSRTKLAEQVVAEVRRYFGSRVYDTIIPRTVRLSEAPGFGLPITAYDPASKGAEAYRQLAHEFLQREATDDPLPDHEPPSVIAIQPPEGPPPSESRTDWQAAEEPTGNGDSDLGVPEWVGGVATWPEVPEPPAAEAEGDDPRPPLAGEPPAEEPPSEEGAADVEPDQQDGAPDGSPEAEGPWGVPWRKRAEGGDVE